MRTLTFRRKRTAASAATAVSRGSASAAAASPRSSSVLLNGVSTRWVTPDDAADCCSSKDGGDGNVGGGGGDVGVELCADLDALAFGGKAMPRPQAPSTPASPLTTASKKKNRMKKTLVGQPATPPPSLPQSRPPESSFTTPPPSDPSPSSASLSSCSGSSSASTPRPRDPIEDFRTSSDDMSPSSTQPVLSSLSSYSNDAAKRGGKNKASPQLSVRFRSHVEEVLDGGDDNDNDGGDDELQTLQMLIDDEEEDIIDNRYSIQYTACSTPAAPPDPPLRRPPLSNPKNIAPRCSGARNRVTFADAPNAPVTAGHDPHGNEIGSMNDGVGGDDDDWSEYTFVTVQTSATAATAASETSLAYMMRYCGCKAPRRNQIGRAPFNVRQSIGEGMLLMDDGDSIATEDLTPIDALPLPPPPPATRKGDLLNGGGGETTTTIVVAGGPLEMTGMAGNKARRGNGLLETVIDGFCARGTV